MAGDEAGVPVEVRFWNRVAKNDDTGCWEWLGALASGYGRIHVPGRGRMQAHRFSYELVTGDVLPDDIQPDHLCRNTSCVNPAHLDPVTPRENYLRGESPMANQARQTECLRGHPLSGDNVRLHGNHRECRICALDGQRRRRAKNRDKVNAAKRAAYALSKGGESNR